MEKYDSSLDTSKHIANVQQKTGFIIGLIMNQVANHDSTKLESPEKETFDEYTPKLKNTTYGSDEYKSHLEGMKVALDHHYSSNRHHPEFHKNGVNDMTLIDLIEMFADWWAATERHADGDLMKSIEYNGKRFEMSPQLISIFQSTYEVIMYEKNKLKIEEE